MTGRLIVALILATVASSPYLSKAEEFTSQDFKIRNPVITIGGGFSQSPNFQLQGSIGQHAPGISGAAAFEVRAGFLFFPAPAAPPVASPVPPPPLIPSGSLVSQYVPISRVPTKCLLIADLNCDGIVGLADLSIFLYWLNRPFDLMAGRFDINGDGQLGLIDISIMFYHWTMA